MPNFPNMPSGAPNPRMMRRRLAGRWSPYRAWHGQEVDLVVDVELIPDGTPVKMTLLEEGVEDPARKIVEWTENVQSSSCKKEKIKFDFQELGYEGAASSFYCLLEVEEFELRVPSEVLRIDTGPFHFSA